jgi:hypothetical protein
MSQRRIGGSDYGIFANAVSDDTLRNGAKVQILQKSDEDGRLRVRGLSIGGREIEKWVDHGKLKDFRVAWLSTKRQTRTHMNFMGEKERLAEIAAGWNAEPGEERT